jgi:hypothetical protein
MVLETQQQQKPHPFFPLVQLLQPVKSLLARQPLEPRLLPPARCLLLDQHPPPDQLLLLVRLLLVRTLQLVRFHRLLPPDQLRLLARLVRFLRVP